MKAGLQPKCFLHWKMPFHWNSISIWFLVLVIFWHFWGDKVKLLAISRNKILIIIQDNLTSVLSKKHHKREYKQGTLHVIHSNCSYFNTHLQLMWIRNLIYWPAKLSRSMNAYYYKSKILKSEHEIYIQTQY